MQLLLAGFGFNQIAGDFRREQFGDTLANVLLSRQLEKLAPVRRQYHFFIAICQRYACEKFDNMARFKPEQGFREALLEGGEGPLVALLPGSRKQEIRHILPLMMGAARLLKQKFPGITLALSPAEPSLVPLVEKITGDSRLDAIIRPGTTYDMMKAADLALVASGTATLETAIVGVPMVIVYKVSSISYWVGRMVIKVPHIGLVNLVAGEEVVPELVQGEVIPHRLASEALRLLEDGDARADVMEKLAGIN